MKKITLIFIGIAIILIGTIYILYKNNIEKKETVIDIYKDDSEDDKKKDKEITKEQMISSKVSVDIKGMIVNPGVYEVDNNMRVNDVINLAGGLLENADTSLINLAKIVTDEMTIIVYSKEEMIEREAKDEPVCNCPIVNNDACLNQNINNNLININTATKEEIMSIPGIGEAKANSIIKHREDNGMFTKIEDIINVSGIGESIFEQIKAYITV